MTSEQRIVRFEGNVQGVGFRYTTRRVAGGYDVTGYVKNLADGAVECVVEGSGEQIDAFLIELQRQMSHYVRNVIQQTAPATGRFVEFGVAF